MLRSMECFQGCPLLKVYWSFTGTSAPGLKSPWCTPWQSLSFLTTKLIHRCWYLMANSRKGYNPPGPQHHHSLNIACLLRLLVPTTSKVISGWVPTYDNAHLWWHYSAATLGDHIVGTMTRYPTQSYYPDTEWTRLYPVPLMLSARLSHDKNRCSKHWFDKPSHIGS